MTPRPPRPSLREPITARRVPTLALLCLAVLVALGVEIAAAPPLGAQAPAETTTDDHPRVVGEVHPDRPFVPAVAAGDFLYLSGAIGLDPEAADGSTIPDALADETRSVLDQMRELLARENLDFSRVVEAELFLADARLFGDVSKIWADEVLATPGVLPPARATVEAAVALRDARLELAMTAAREGVEVERIVPEGWPSSSGRPYSWGVRAGDTLFIAGMVANDPATGTWRGGDAAAQTTQVMKNVEAVLHAADYAWGDVARCRVFLADARDYGAVNEAYGRFFDTAPPARSTVQARLVIPDGRVEIQCVAVRDPERRVVLAAGTKAPDRPFSPSIEAGGRLFVAGMVGRGPDGYPDGVEAQTRVALERAKAVLDAAGLGWRDVVSVRVFLADVRYYDAMNRVYQEIFGAPYPARATVGTPLASPEALVEIEVTAVTR